MNAMANNAMAMAVAGVMVCALAGCGGESGMKAERLTIRDGDREWTFIPVDGKSRLNLSEIMDTEGSQGKNTDIVSMPLFWIAEKPVSEEEFAVWTGRRVRAGVSPEQPVRGIEWEEALICCEQFSKRYASQLPRGVFASMPTSQEWAHAVKVLDYPVWLDGDVGTFLFTRNQYGGFLCAPGKNLPVQYDLATTLVTVPKRGKRDFAGLRFVLVDIKGGTILTNGKPFDNTMVSRGVILATCGFLKEARKQLECVLIAGKPSTEERERAEGALAFVREEHDTGFEDWNCFVEVAARSAEKMGFETQPYATLWSLLNSDADMENEEVVKAYAAKGIFGEFVAIGNLPEDVRKHQMLGEKYSISILRDRDIESQEFEISSENVVQVLRCDFTGDGVEDMVVESFGNVGSGGYFYDFFAGRPDGGHDLCESIQTVGLCALPKAGGGACGFLNFTKYANPVLEAEILTFKDGKAVFNRAVDLPTVMIDTFPDRVYAPAPFIGPDYGLGWKILEGRGYWYRPLFWPWKPGFVQGLSLGLDTMGDASGQYRAAMK